MEKIFLYSTIILLSGSVFAQRYTELQIDQMIEDIDQMVGKEPDKVLPASFKCYNYSKEINYKKGMANSLLLTGKGLLSLEQYDTALAVSYTHLTLPTKA